MKIMNLAIAFGMLGGAVACEEASGPISPDHVGVYQLQSINGQEPPVEIPSQSFDKLELLSATRTLLANGTYHTEFHWLETVADGHKESQVKEDGDFYSLGDISIGFQPDDRDDSYSGSLDGDVLTIHEPGFTSIYVR